MYMATLNVSLYRMAENSNHFRCYGDIHFKQHFHSMKWAGAHAVAFEIKSTISMRFVGVIWITATISDASVIFASNCSSTKKQ
ncbi:hypothetical protein CEXT_169851 [Caerostris extrusa]|uniref:Uncharacterized protein n=1 Tax=Caerostris extrusa TaxID=172846 RepID=A0AAV4UNC6_CAEEX|nr:hypothetical protein CEXT_169851 [Caerostris extrusa]